ncbi:MAG: response regulator [Saprospiraceae bacterium]|nr:response regulator [Saprospiraceae bacterium]
MSKSPIKFWNSIVIRFAIFFTGLILVAILISGYIVFRKSSVVILEGAKERLQHSVELAEQSFKAQLNEVSNDIAMISENLALKNYVNHRTSTNAANLGQLFAATLHNKPDYFQIRFIDQSGKEVIRFDKMNGEIMPISIDDLQQKGGRDYFQESIEMNRGQYYFSRINLNEEHGIVSEPPIVTLRAASPVFDDQERKVGILVINVDLNRFNTQLDNISSHGIFTLLLDEYGQYLHHPNAEMEFSRQRNSNFSFGNDYAQPLNSLPPGVGNLRDTKGNFYIDFLRPLEYMQGKRVIYLMSAIDEDTLLDSARKVRRESFQNLAIVCLFSILLSYLFSTLFSEKINSVTQAIAKYEEGNPDVILPVDRKDEIGLLARSFAKMRKRVEQTLLDLNNSLLAEKKATDQREEFLQNMSHELRTPLHTIRGLTGLLKKNKPNKSQLPIISSLEKSVENLTGLVHDVLDHQKLVEGKLPLNKKTVNLGELLNDIYKTYQFEALQKGLKFNFQIAHELYDLSYETDPLRISQVVTNLIVNAIKFTHQGTILLRAWRETEEQDRLFISVTDSGVGILEENLKKINERSFQERPEVTGRYGGYGLGLSIVKQLTSLLGGKLRAESRKNIGSTFTVEIPIIAVTKKGDLNNPAALSQEYLPNLPEKLNIIHLDDDSSSLDLLSHLLASGPFVIKQFQDFEQLTNALNQQKPDLIITDLILKQNDIQERLQEFQEKRQGSCPLIVVSAKENEVLKKISPYYFQKPFDGQLLIDQIYTILGAKYYPVPDFTYLEKNYDYQLKKVNHAMDLLGLEFQEFIVQLTNLRETQDLLIWQSITHKLVTHAKSLQLNNLIPILQNNHQLPDRKVLGFVEESLKYCLCKMRLQKWINSTI